MAKEREIVTRLTQQELWDQAAKELYALTPEIQAEVQKFNESPENDLWQARYGAGPDYFAGKWGVLSATIKKPRRSYPRDATQQLAELVALIADEFNLSIYPVPGRYNRENPKYGLKPKFIQRSNSYEKMGREVTT